jgi:hypothetical protein
MPTTSCEVRQEVQRVCVSGGGAVSLATRRRSVLGIAYVFSSIEKVIPPIDLLLRCALDPWTRDILTASWLVDQLGDIEDPRTRGSGEQVRGATCR